MIATQDAKPRYDRRTDSALDAAEPACRLIEELLASIPKAGAAHREKAAEVARTIQKLSLECARNATDAAKSRELLQKAVGLQQPEPAPKGRRSASAEKQDDETYVRRLGGEWAEAIREIRVEAGVRLWGPAIAAAHRSGCDPAHVLQLVKVWKAYKHKFDNPAGELHSRVRNAHPDLDPYEAWSEPTPKPKRTFDELLAEEFGAELEVEKATRSAPSESLLRRWMSFHDRHVVEGMASYRRRENDYRAYLNTCDIDDETWQKALDAYRNCFGLTATRFPAKQKATTTPARGKAVPR